MTGPPCLDGDSVHENFCTVQPERVSSGSGDLARGKMYEPEGTVGEGFVREGMRNPKDEIRTQDERFRGPRAWDGVREARAALRLPWTDLRFRTPSPSGEAHS